MGGKKKSLASRLAKMSDEERARYLQMKADQEEEVRRRKEQLVTAFMKNKIKREDAFARLNKAKINQQWHQFMRLRKCKEMKENCEHSKKWIERVMALKNRTIDNLMKELDEAEFQYSTNLQAHLQHVDNFLDFHRGYLEQIRNEFENDLDLLLEEAFNERMIFEEKSGDEMEHLKTLVYGQEIEGRAFNKECHDHYLKVNEEFVKECKQELKISRKKCYDSSGTIWRDISVLLRDYVGKTDKRRAQLADMKRLDAESAVEINQNQERINLQEIDVEKLKDEYVTLKATRVNVIKSLEAATKVVNVQCLNAKRNLQNELTQDEKKLRFLTATSKRYIADLEELVRRGEYVVQLSQACRRFETEKEKVLRFSDLPVETAAVSSSPSEEDDDETPRTDVVEEVFMKIRMESIESKDEDEEEEDGDEGESDVNGTYGREYKQRVRKIKDTTKYKILIRHKYKPKIKTSLKLNIGERLRRELSLVPATSTACPKRKLKRDLSEENFDEIPDGTLKDGIIEEDIESLLKLDPIWFLYNRVKLDYVELREERARLAEENQLLKKTIRTVLENAMLKGREPSKQVKKFYICTA